MPTYRNHLPLSHGTALLVIDAQQSFEHAPYWSPVDTPVFYDRLQSLVDGAQARQIPVVQIFHVEESGHFSLGSGFIRPLAALSIQPQAVFHKPRHSALIGCGLPVWLIEHGIQRLIISGIRTEQCCETTTRHASDSGYQVDFVSEATLTFAMTDRAGRRWSAEDIKARTELVLEGRFARLLNVQQVLSAADEARAA
jgi:nicotinamidase-related amidase